MARILVIDDQPEVRKITRRLLEHSGFEVEVACEGDEGIRLHTQSPFDVIITDLVMPGREGFETISCLQKSPTNPAIIAMSGFSNAAYLDAAKCLGADYVLPKPFSRAELLDTVQEALRGSKDSCPTPED